MHVVIIGNGITGATAALELRQLDADCRITMISGESKFHFSRPALMYIFMGHMSYQQTKPHPDSTWADNRIELLRDWITDIDTASKQLSLHKGGTLDYDRLLIATGARSNKFGWPGQDLQGVQGLYDLPDLKRLHDNVITAKQAVIVGGGLIGIELAEMLHSCGVPVTFLVRESSYWNNVLPEPESAMVSRLIRQAGFGLKLETGLKEIEDDGTGRVGAIITDKDERIECQLVGLTAGVSPNIQLVKETAIDTGRGILVDWSLRTNVADVFAAGDCAEIVTEGDGRNLLQQVWYTGKMQARIAARGLAGLEATYDPGIWYNSAKFLDLEYHTYGQVNLCIPAEQNLYWEHPDGLHSIRIVYLADRVIGINTMGVRFRHRLCEAWIAEQRPLEYVLEHLAEANFDPEFCRRFEAHAAAQFSKAVA